MLSMVGLLVLAALHVATAGEYLLDGARVGRKFDGIGGLSGGGATSRLLVDYEPKVRDHLLDLLFKPKFGASLQILKHEIGGDTFSGCGTEPSHMRSADEENYNRGYEWWLMEEAEKRHPGIIGYGLPWGFPAWVAAGASPAYPTPGFSPLTNATANYIAKWVQGAKQHHGHEIQYVGLWNERQYTTDYIKALRRELNKHGAQHTKIVVSDNPDGSDTVILKQMEDDPELRDIVDVIGIHYPQGSVVSAAAVASGITLWSSEESSTIDNERGAGCWARVSNWNYVYGNMTASIMWNLVSSYYERLFFYGDSFMDASEPWSGNYTIRDPVWAAAHTTQFTETGWDYLQHGAGAGALEKGGTYVTFISPDRRDFSIVIETMKKAHSLCIRNNPDYDWAVTEQEVSLRLRNLPVKDLSASGPRPLHVWKSCFFAPAGPFSFLQQQDLIVNASGFVSFVIEPDCVLTITTTSGQSKAGGVQQSIPSAPFPIPYNDNFEGYEDDKMAKYFSDMAGSFSVNASAQALQQRVLASPSVGGTGWGPQDSVQPISIIGTYSLVDYEVSASVVILRGPSQIYGTRGFSQTNAMIAVRVGGSLTKGECDDPNGCVQANSAHWYNYGYYLFVGLDPLHKSAMWQLFRGGQAQAVADGELPEGAAAVGKRFRMSLAVQKSTLTMRFGSSAQSMRVLGSYTDPDNSFKQGFAAIGSGWHETQFSDFALANVASIHTGLGI